MEHPFTMNASGARERLLVNEPLKSTDGRLRRLSSWTESVSRAKLKQTCNGWTCVRLAMFLPYPTMLALFLFWRDNPVSSQPRREPVTWIEVCGVPIQLLGYAHVCLECSLMAMLQPTKHPELLAHRWWHFGLTRGHQVECILLLCTGTGLLVLNVAGDITSVITGFLFQLILVWFMAFSIVRLVYAVRIYQGPAMSKFVQINITRAATILLVNAAVLFYVAQGLLASGAVISEWALVAVERGDETERLALEGPLSCANLSTFNDSLVATGSLSLEDFADFVDWQQA